MITIENLIAELERRDKSKLKLADYAVATVGTIAAQHHLMIYDALERLVADEYDDLVINTPPGSAKSTLASHVFPSWYLGRFPENNVIIASHTISLAEKWSRRSRDTVSSKEHSAIFPESALSKDSTSVGLWTTTKGGECIAAGVGMALLGRRGDCIIIDDPVSGWEQAQSLTHLQKIHDWFKSDLKSRLKPKAKIVVICQRLSPNDLAGFMIKENAEAPTRRLRVINLPMVCNSEDDPLGRAIGERLWPEWYSDEMVKDLQKDDFIWRTMWQQQPPSDDGSWVSTEDIQFRPRPTITDKSILYGMTDLALSVNTGDYTVHLVVAIDEVGDWDVVHGTRERVDPEKSSSRLVELAGMYRCQEWLIDDDNASKVFMPLVATQARTTRTMVPWKPMPMRGIDKETRAAPLRGQFKRRKVYMPADAPYTKWLVKELLTFPNATGSGVDDGIDALGLLGRRMTALAKPTAPVVQLKRPTLQEMTLNQLFEDMPTRSTQRI